MLFQNRRSWSLALILVSILAVASACTASKPVDLFAIVRESDAPAVKLALDSGADANSRDNWGRTPLIVALQQGKTATAEVLVSKGANASLTDAWGRTPLLVATQLRNTIAVRLLLGKGVDVDAANKNDITPLIAAAQTGNREAADLLIAKGALLDKQDNIGWTALMWAANRNDGETVRMLLSKGADARKVGRDNATALDLAKKCGAEASLIAAIAEKALPGAVAATSVADCDKTSTSTARQTALIKPSIDPARIFRGPANAPITIIEYTDFQCPYCGFGAKTLEEVMAKYEGQVKLVVKHFPLPFHPMAMPSALYFEAVSLQSSEKAWQFYDRVFSDLKQLSAGGESYLQKVASDIGVDMKKLEQDVRSQSTYGRIAADLKEVEQFKFDGVPAFVINGKVLLGAQPPQKFFDIIDAALRK
jgi:protein-disulfide isomerase